MMKYVVLGLGALILLVTGEIHSVVPAAELVEYRSELDTALVVGALLFLIGLLDTSGGV